MFFYRSSSFGELITLAIREKIPALLIPWGETLVNDMRGFFEKNDSPKPLFLLLYLTDTHYPYWTPGPDSGLEDPYDREVRYTDERFGEILELLKKHGYYENSMIVFTSDHGEAFGEFNQYRHMNSPFWPVSHVPLMIKYPASRQASPCRSSNPLGSFNVMPTILDAACIDWKSLGLDAGSLLPFGAVPDSRPVLTEFEDEWSIVDGHWQYIVNRDNKKELLFDLSQKPVRIEDDLLKKYPDVAETMRSQRARLEELAAKSKDNFKERNAALPADEKEKLRALGYVQ